MRVQELINDIITTYVTLVTLITVIFYVMGSYFFPDASFGYESFASPLIFAACATLPNLLMYSKKELSTRAYLIRKSLQFVLIEVIVLAIAFPDRSIYHKQPAIAITLAISVFVIFILTHLYDFFKNLVSAKRMTAELLLFQQNHKL